MLAAGSGWSEGALKIAYSKGLSLAISLELACCDKQKALDTHIDLSICVDYLLQNCPPPLLANKLSSDSNPVESM